MKVKLFYILPFVLAFIMITGGLIYFNSIFENIFEFNFSPRQLHSDSQDSTKTPADSLKTTNDNDTTYFVDSHSRNKLDSLLSFYKNNSDTSRLSALQKDSTLLDSIKTITDLINETKPNIADTTESVSELFKPNEINKKQDAEYSNWIKKITSIYESMEPKKAAKIIQNYSDNVARDILYTMKKKTAAKVLAELSPETVNRIISYQ